MQINLCQLNNAEMQFYPVCTVFSLFLKMLKHIQTKNDVFNLFIANFTDVNNDNTKYMYCSVKKNEPKSDTNAW